MSPFIEPELRGPTPRHVVARTGLRVARGAVLALTAFILWRWSLGEKHAIGTALRVVAFAGICWGPFEFGVARMRRMLRVGRATEGRIEDLRRVRSALRYVTEFLAYFVGHFHYGSTLLIRYHYLVAEDRWREVERALDEDLEGRIGDPGGRVTVLVDPGNPRRHALYPTLLRWLRVEAPVDD